MLMSVHKGRHQSPFSKPQSFYIFIFFRQSISHIKYSSFVFDQVSVNRILSIHSQNISFVASHRKYPPLLENYIHQKHLSVFVSIPSNQRYVQYKREKM